MADRMQAIQQKPKRRVWLRRLLWTFGVLAAGVLILEATLRSMGYAERATMYYDPKVGFRSWPNQTRWQLGRDMEPTVQMRLNGIGFRGPELSKGRIEGRVRILTMGDSYNFGLGVEDGETYPVLLKEVLNADGENFEVMDISYPGWAPVNVANAYEEIGREYQPDTVIFGFTFNDLQLPDGGMRYTDGPFFQMFGNTAIGWAITTKLLNKLPEFLVEDDEATLALRKAYFDKGNGIPLKAHETDAEPYWEQAMAAIVRMQDAVESDGGRLMVGYFPALQQLQKLNKMRAKGELDSKRSQACRLQEELQRRCALAGVEFFDCTDALFRLDGDPFDGKDPGHPGPTGLRALAQEVAQRFLDQPE